jgi:polyisoprenoid-binding protein YceI
MGTTPASTTATDLSLAAGTWPLDAAHSGVHFKVRHIGLSNVRGRFNRFDATLSVGETLADTRVEATIEMSSVDTNQPDRDTHLLGTDFFSADQHPLMTFRSTGIRVAGDGGYALDGELTVNGVTRQVTLDVEFYGVETHPADGSTHAGFSATTTVDRGDFGVDFNVPLGMDRFALGKKIAVELELQFVAPEDRPARGAPTPGDGPVTRADAANEPPAP